MTRKTGTSLEHAAEERLKRTKGNLEVEVEWSTSNASVLTAKHILHQKPKSSGPIILISHSMRDTFTG